MAPLQSVLHAMPAKRQFQEAPHACGTRPVGSAGSKCVARSGNGVVLPSKTRPAPSEARHQTLEDALCRLCACMSSGAACPCGVLKGRGQSAALLSWCQAATYLCLDYFGHRMHMQATCSTCGMAVSNGSLGCMPVGGM